MKKFIACILLVLLGMVSCKEEAIPRPDDLLSKEQMAAILYDITLINSTKGVNKNKLDETYLAIDTYLYKKHNIDSLQFKRSNNYYAANPNTYSEIYGLVQARLTRERKAVGEKLEAEQKRKDSLREAKNAARKSGKKDSVGKLQPEFKKKK